MSKKNYIILILISINCAFAQSMNMSFIPDTRKSLPLTAMMAEHQKQSMRGHLEAIRDILDAFTTNDFKKIEESGKKLGTSPEMKMMCEHFGAASPGFNEIALKMHTAADKITEAGKNKNLKEAMLATSLTLKNCTSCHAIYKQDVISDDEWKKLVK
jgi:cytochrome c556